MRIFKSYRCGQQLRWASYRRPDLLELKRVDAHVIQPEEYEDLPEMTDEMFARTVFKKAGRPRSPNPMQMIRDES